MLYLNHFMAKKDGGYFPIENDLRRKRNLKANHNEPKE